MKAFITVDDNFIWGAGKTLAKAKANALDFYKNAHWDTEDKITGGEGYTMKWLESSHRTFFAQVDADSIDGIQGDSLYEEIS